MPHGGFQFHVAVELEVQTVGQVVTSAGISGEGIAVFAAFRGVVAFQSEEGNQFLIAFQHVVVSQLEAVAEHSVTHIGIGNGIGAGEVPLCVIANEFKVFHEPVAPAVLSLNVPQVDIGVGGGVFLIVAKISGGTAGKAFEPFGVGGGTGVFQTHCVGELAVVSLGVEIGAGIAHAFGAISERAILRRQTLRHEEEPAQAFHLRHITKKAHRAFHPRGRNDVFVHDGAVYRVE